MAVLIISRNAYKSSMATKLPGLRLVEKLESDKVFTLIDVPSYFYMNSILGRIQVLYKYILSIFKLISSKDKEFFFYNFTPAYLGLYLVIICLILKRPNLFLADGDNCLAMKHSPNFFLKLFKKVISLPLNELIATKLTNNNRTIWYPGYYDGILEFKKYRVQSAKPVLLFNSTLTSHNGPELALLFAQLNPWLDLVITSDRVDIEKYLKKRFFDKVPSIPVNVKFIGLLEYSNYIDLIKSVDGILLCRDENIFANKYNFPSKFIEALKYDIPVLSFFPISSVSDNIYFLIDYNDKDLINNIQSFIESKKANYIQSRNHFLKCCDTARLLKWLSIN